MTRIKQRKAMTSIYTLRDQNDHWVEGFDVAADVMISYYKDLLGKKEHYRTQVDQQVIRQGHCLSIDSKYSYARHLVIQKSSKLCSPFQITNH